MTTTFKIGDIVTANQPLPFQANTTYKVLLSFNDSKTNFPQLYVEEMNIIFDSARTFVVRPKDVKLA